MGHSKDAIKKVNDFVQECGIEANEITSDYGSEVCWSLIKGSAQIYVYVDKCDDDESPFITVVSPLVRVPPAQKTLELFEYCMVANSSIQSFALSFNDDKSVITLIHDRPCEGLDTSELEYIMRFLGHIADKYDNILVEKFGCTSPNISTTSNATNTMESIGN